MSSDVPVPASARFPIRELSARTRVNTVTIRAWERRYGLLKPARTDKGHRLYSEWDVQRVEQILSWTSRGVPVSKVKQLLDGEVADLAPKAIPRQGTGPHKGHWSDQVSALLEAVAIFSSRRVQTLLADNFLQYSPALCGSCLLEPAAERLQSRPDWQAQFSFLQSEILTYAMTRLEINRKQQGGDRVWLVCGRKTPIWRLAVTALQLADGSRSLLFMVQPCSVEIWLQLARANSNRTCIVYQDGRWRDDQLRRVNACLPELPELMLCGAAPMIAGLVDSNRFFATPEKLVEHILRGN